jgi:hypothetical protein
VAWEIDRDEDLHGVMGRWLRADGSFAGPQFAVNLTQQYDQSNPAVGVAPSGRAIVTWTSYDQDGQWGGIFARFVELDGTPTGPEIQINQQTIGHQDFSRVGIDSHGRFVVAWTTYELADWSGSVRIRRFTEKGQPMGPEWVLQSPVPGDDRLTNLDVEPLGDAVVTWTNHAKNGIGQSVYAQAIDAQGAPMGVPIALSRRP